MLIFTCICTHIVSLMDYMTPPMFDVSNIDVWKIKMSMYLKTIGLHVFLTATKKSYLDNSKHIEANAQAPEALRSTLSKEYLCMVSYCDSAFAVWNTLTSPKLQTTKIWRRNLVEMSLTKLATWSKEMTPLR